MKIKISGEEARTRKPVFLDFKFSPHGTIGTGIENEAVVQPTLSSIKEFLDIHNIDNIEILNIKPIDLKTLLRVCIEAREKRIKERVGEVL